MSSPPASSSSSSSPPSLFRRPNLRPWDPKIKGPEPLPPQNLSKVEEAAIKTLLDAHLLLYNNADRIAPEFIKDIKKADEVWDTCALFPLKARPLHKLTSRLAEAANTSLLLEKFRDDLLLNVGSDVIAGTIFALNINNSEEEKKYCFLHDNPGSAFAPLDLAARSFKIKTIESDTTPGGEYTFPISNQDADDLISGGEDSLVGVEGKGDQFDRSVRQSTEYRAENLDLPPWLHHPRRFFPRLERMIKEKLCPSAANIAIVPYKLVCYKEGDFFKQHRDSTNEENHFGTLAIHLPCESDFADYRPFDENPETFQWYDDSSSSSNSNDDDGNDETDNTIDSNNNNEDRRNHGGALRFFLGRGIAEESVNYGEENEPGSAIQNLMRGDYGRQHDTISQLTATCLMQNYTNEELHGKHPLVSASANRLAEPLHRPDGTDMTEEEAIAEADGNEDRKPPSLFHIKKENGVREITLKEFQNQFVKKTHPPEKMFSSSPNRKHTPLHFSAWMADLFHEVRPIAKGGRRIVLTYKLKKDKHVCPVRIPREIALSSQVEQIAASFKKLVQNFRAKDSDGPKTFGFLLRHSYSVSALAEPWKSLKGVDAVVHHLLSSRFKTVLAPVILSKDNDVGVPFRDDEDSSRHVFLTSGVRQEVKELLTHDHAADKFHSHAPLITRCEFKELGFGLLEARSGSYGNWDCGAAWSYKTTALVCLLDQSSDWDRRKIAFLIQEKGYEGNYMQVFGDRFWPIFRNIVKFL